MSEQVVSSLAEKGDMVAEPVRRCFSVDEYYRMGEAGILTDDAGRYWVPSSSVVSPEAGLRPLPPQSLS